MSQTECPKCHALQARRVKQEGFFQKVVLQRIGIFPWECRFCKATFKLRNRGHRTADARKRSRSEAATQSARQEAN